MVGVATADAGNAASFNASEAGYAASDTTSLTGFEPQPATSLTNFLRRHHCSSLDELNIKIKMGQLEAMNSIAHHVSTIAREFRLAHGVSLGPSKRQKRAAERWIHWVDRKTTSTKPPQKLAHHQANVDLIDHAAKKCGREEATAEEVSHDKKKPHATPRVAKRPSEGTRLSPDRKGRSQRQKPTIKKLLKRNYKTQQRPSEKCAEGTTSEVEKDQHRSQLDCQQPSEHHDYDDQNSFEETDDRSHSPDRDDRPPPEHQVSHDEHYVEVSTEPSERSTYDEQYYGSQEAFDAAQEHSVGFEHESEPASHAENDTDLLSTGPYPITDLPAVRNKPAIGEWLGQFGDLTGMDTVDHRQPRPTESYVAMNDLRYREPHGQRTWFALIAGNELAPNDYRHYDAPETWFPSDVEQSLAGIIPDHPDDFSCSYHDDDDGASCFDGGGEADEYQTEPTSYEPGEFDEQMHGFEPSTTFAEQGYDHYEHDHGNYDVNISGPCLCNNTLCPSFHACL